MTNVFDALIRLKTMRKGGAGLPTREWREALLSEYLSTQMHEKLNQVHRARRRRGQWL